jgi:hypothetical protein
MGRTACGNTMRLPLELAAEIGSYLNPEDLVVCTTQLCIGGVEFVSRPRTDTTETTMEINLHELVLCCRLSHWSLLKRLCAKAIAREAVKRIELWLARHTSVEKVVLRVKFYGTPRELSDRFVSSALCRHLNTVPCLQANTSGGLAVEWHVQAKSLSAVGFLLRATLAKAVSGPPLLAACLQTLHTLELAGTRVKDVSVLAGCQSLHTLNLSWTGVTDVSALALSPALHTLNLRGTQVSDVTALASFQSLHTLNLRDTQVRAT